MDRKQVQQVAFEIAIMGQRGLDTNGSAKEHTLRTLPGQYSGLHLISLMYAGFQVVDASYSIAFDLSKEYQAVRSLYAAEQK